MIHTLKVEKTAEEYLKLTIQILQKLPQVNNREYEQVLNNYALYLASKQGFKDVAFCFEDLPKNTYGNYDEAEDLITLNKLFQPQKDESRENFHDSQTILNLLSTLAHEHAHRQDFANKPTTFVKFGNEKGHTPRLQYTGQFAIVREIFDKYSPAYDNMEKLAHSAYISSDWEMYARKRSREEMQLLEDVLNKKRDINGKKKRLPKLFQKPALNAVETFQKFNENALKTELNEIKNIRQMRNIWPLVDEKFNLVLREYAADAIVRGGRHSNAKTQSMESGLDPKGAQDRRRVIENDFFAFVEILDSPFIMRQENYDLFFQKTTKLMREYAISDQNAAYVMLRLISSPYNKRAGEMLDVLYNKVLRNQSTRNEFQTYFKEWITMANSKNWGAINEEYVDQVYKSSLPKTQNNFLEKYF